MTNIKSITQKRNGDKIEFSNYRGEVVACLFDHHGHIIHEKFANSVALFLDEVPAQNYPEIFAEIGLDVATARAIDAMPVPDAQLPNV